MQEKIFLSETWQNFREIFKKDTAKGFSRCGTQDWELVRDANSQTHPRPD